MSKLVTPPNIGWYAVARDRGKIRVAVGPLPPSDAHRAVDTLIRPEARNRGLSFLDFGVIRMVLPVGERPPVFTILDGRVAA